MFLLLRLFSVLFLLFVFLLVLHKLVLLPLVVVLLFLLIALLVLIHLVCQLFPLLHFLRFWDSNFAQYSKQASEFLSSQSITAQSCREVSLSPHYLGRKRFQQNYSVPPICYNTGIAIVQMSRWDFFCRKIFSYDKKTYLHTSADKYSLNLIQNRCFAWKSPQ